MNLLEAEAAGIPGAALQPPDEELGPPAGPLPDDLLAPVELEGPQEEGGLRCHACGSQLAADEGWCLACGAAAVRPRRPPGLRAVMLAGSVALVLAGGAAAAGYAALNDTPPKQQVKVQTVAKLTPAPPPVAEVTPTTSTTTDTPPPAPAPLPVQSPVTPVTPITPVTPVATTPKPAPKPKPVKPAPAPGTVPLLVGLLEGSLYDPAKLAVAAGEPSRALDGDPNTSWFATTAADADMKVGFLIGLESAQPILKLRLDTKTPGFSVQVFGANGGKAPAAADSAGWKALGEAGSVDGDPPAGSPSSIKPVDGDKAGDGELVLPLDTAGKSYRWVMLWLTTPPAAGPTVRFNELRLYR